MSPDAGTPLERFERSRVRDLERWREGIGYDLDAIREASARERAAIEQILVASRPLRWYDVEALAVLGTPAARSAIRAATHDPDPEVRVAVCRFAGDLIGEDARASALVYAIENATIYGGLTLALLEAESFHPPEVVEALRRGARDREGDVAIHLAGLLLYLAGVAAEPFDWALRPFLLRFTEDDPVKRAEAFAELEKMVDPASSGGVG